MSMFSSMVATVCDFPDPNICEHAFCASVCKPPTLHTTNDCRKWSILVRDTLFSAIKDQKSNATDSIDVQTFIVEDFFGVR